MTDFYATHTTHNQIPRNDPSSSHIEQPENNLFNETLLHFHRILSHQIHQTTQNSIRGSPSIVAPPSITPSTSPTASTNNGTFQIPLYTTILLLSITGNTLVILTLVQNRRMRTITNVFLLNLAVSDILLGVLCMPFTLVGQLLRDFVFGRAMCKLLPYLQGKLDLVYLN